MISSSARCHGKEKSDDRNLPVVVVECVVVVTFVPFVVFVVLNGVVVKDVGRRVVVVVVGGAGYGFMKTKIA